MYEVCERPNLEVDHFEQVRYYPSLTSVYSTLTCVLIPSATRPKLAVGVEKQSATVCEQDNSLHATIIISTWDGNLSNTCFIHCPSNNESVSLPDSAWYLILGDHRDTRSCTFKPCSHHTAPDRFETDLSLFTLGLKLI